MPAVVTDAVLDHRRRLGLDKSDERWAGEWHLVNPPKIWHSVLNTELGILLGLRAKERGLQPHIEATGLFAADDDWRVPDQVYAVPGSRYGDAGLGAAELVVELRSPGDDSYKKLPFYGRKGVAEVLIIHEDRRVELYRPGDDGQLHLVAPPGSTVRCQVLDVELATVDGPRLRVTWDGGSAEV